MKILGRQKLSAEDIEEKAAILLRLFRPDYFDYVMSTPVKKIAAFLSEKYNVVFDFKATLGFADNGERILGATNLKKHIILVDQSLEQDEHKFNFTLAHELGHLSLHRKLEFIRDETEEIGPKETIYENFNERSKNLVTEADWIEWQANAYATSLLMPAKVVKMAVVLQQEQMGIRSRGKIFLDDQSCNQRDFFEIITKLSEFFKVSRTATENRIRKLDIVEDHRPGLQSIQEIFKTKGLS